MTIEAVLLWAVVGIIAGWLASTVAGGGQGLLGNLVVGIVGAFIGGLVFRALGVSAPLGGLAGTIFMAFVGAVVLLILLRIVRRLAAGSS
jgi:uncharacterized membrane protein YeaQ/YmgE (transglycosylase-associated protein family)